MNASEAEAPHNTIEAYYWQYGRFYFKLEEYLHHGGVTQEIMKWQLNTVHAIVNKKITNNDFSDKGKISSL